MSGFSIQSSKKFTMQKTSVIFTCLLAAVAMPQISAWKENVVAATLAALVVVQPAHSVDIQGNSVLERGQSWRSNTANLVMQEDGNLVIYDEFNKPRWDTKTVNQGWRTIFQSDGNLVVYSNSGKPVWATYTHGHPGSRLAVQDDGNVVIYDGSQALWASYTHH